MLMFPTCLGTCVRLEWPRASQAIWLLPWIDRLFIWRLLRDIRALPINSVLVNCPLLMYVLALILADVAPWALLVCVLAADSPSLLAQCLEIFLWMTFAFVIGRCDRVGSAEVSVSLCVVVVNEPCCCVYWPLRLADVAHWARLKCMALSLAVMAKWALLMCVLAAYSPSPLAHCPSMPPDHTWLCDWSLCGLVIDQGGRRCRFDKSAELKVPRSLPDFRLAGYL